MPLRRVLRRLAVAVRPPRRELLDIIDAQPHPERPKYLTGERGLRQVEALRREAVQRQAARDDPRGLGDGLGS